MQRPLSQPLRDALLRHLQTEADLLQRIQEVAAILTIRGFQTPALQERQADLSRLLSEMLTVQLERQDLRVAIGQHWECDADSVKLSLIRFEDQDATAALQRVREKLVTMTVSTGASLKTAEAALRGWSGIVNYVLGELLESPGHSDRYAANGQRVAATRLSVIDVRT